MSAQTTRTARQTDKQAAVVQAIRSHHRKLGRTVADHALTIGRVVDQLVSPAAPRDRLVRFFADEVLPHATAEERTLYAAGADLPQTALLVRAMTAEHAALRDLLGTLERARTSAETAGAAAALDALFQSHLHKENDVLLPALVEAGVDLEALLTGMHEILGAEGEHGRRPAEAGDPAREQGGACGCTCGGHDADSAAQTAEVVNGELDVRRLAHGRRHEEIFATFRALRTGEAFTLVNDHDPKPLYYQFAAVHPGEFDWEYVESGPEVWRVRIGRL